MSEVKQAVKQSEVKQKEVSAKARFELISPRKVRRVADLIRGKSVQEAEQILAFLPHRPARLLKKVLHSASANASNNHHLGKNLVVSRAVIDQGPILRRSQPRARGRAFPINKRMSHITLSVRGE